MGVAGHKEVEKTNPETEEKPGHSIKERKRTVQEEGGINLLVDLLRSVSAVK